MRKYNDISIIIQGRVNSNIITQLSSLDLVDNNNIILSTWANIDEKLLHEICKYIPEKNVILNQIINDFKGVNNLANRYLLTHSTLEGLLKVKTEYVLKLRGDEYYSNLERLFDFFYENKDKIISTNVFFRPERIWPYHISDHVIIGSIDRLINMFTSAKHGLILKKECKEYGNKDKRQIINNYEEYRDSLPFEVILTVEYLKFMGEKITYENSKDVMFKYFEVMDVDNLKPYQIVHNHNRVVYNSDIKAIQSDIIRTSKDYNL